MEDYVSCWMKAASEKDGIDIQKGQNSISVYMPLKEGYRKSTIYVPFPHLHLVCDDLKCQTVYMDETEASGNGAQGENTMPDRAFHMEFCITGRTEWSLPDNSFFYMDEGDYCLTDLLLYNDFFFPKGHYQGFSIFPDPDFFDGENPLLKAFFDLPLSQLKKSIQNPSRLYVDNMKEQSGNPAEKIWECHEKGDLFHLKIAFLDLLHSLLTGPVTQSEEKKLPVFYTALQVETAKKAEAIFTSDLKEHIPIKTVAQTFGISETSLKNYFKEVYGMNISDYLREKRMETAERMLLETSLSISEISYEIGYTKQGKFAEVFRKKYGQNPLSYRRAKRLENC